jgi:hypothetical protein
MPPIVVVVVTVVTFVLAMVLGTAQVHTGSAVGQFLGVASGGTIVIVGFGILVAGMVIVYKGTHSIGLTIGFFVVHWLEGFILSFVLTVALLASLGLHSSATKPTTVIPTPRAAVTSTPSSKALSRVSSDTLLMGNAST